MKIFVTGGSGFIGSSLVCQLTAAGHEVLAPSHRECDVHDTQAVAGAVAGCDSVIHLAHAPMSAPDRDVIDTTVNGTVSILRACEAHGVRDLMLVSSPWAGNGTCYGTGKQVQETLAEAWQQSGALDRVVIARVFNAYGSGMGTGHVIPQFILWMMQNPEAGLFPVRGSGWDVRSFIHGDDCAVQLTELFCRAPSGTGRYDVGTTDEPQTTAALAQLVAGCFGRVITVVPEQSRAAATMRVPHPPGLLAELPHRSLGAGLRQTVAWYREREAGYGD